MTVDNFMDHVMVFSAWSSLLLLSIDRFVFITRGLEHEDILSRKRYHRSLKQL